MEVNRVQMASCCLKIFLLYALSGSPRRKRYYSQRVRPRNWHLNKQTEFTLWLLEFGTGRALCRGLAVVQVVTGGRPSLENYGTHQRSP